MDIATYEMIKGDVKIIKPFTYANTLDTLTISQAGLTQGSFIKFKTPDVYKTFITEIELVCVSPPVPLVPYVYSSIASLHTDLKVSGSSIFSDSVDLEVGYALRDLPQYSLKNLFIEVDENTYIDYILYGVGLNDAVSFSARLTGYYGVRKKKEQR